MARRVFFSFHFERDIWRVGQVRNCWLTKPDRESAGYWDAAKWEAVKKEGDEAIKRWINNALKGASVTVVLIGAETNTRKWVHYEIGQSGKVGKGMLGIYIHNIRDQKGRDIKGENPFNCWHTTIKGQKVFFNQLYSTYDWVTDDGYKNLRAWIEKAARDADE